MLEAQLEVLILANNQVESVNIPEVHPHVCLPALMNTSIPVIPRVCGGGSNYSMSIAQTA